MVPFSPRAALCTLVVVGGLAAALTSHLAGGLFGLIGWERDGLLTLDHGGSPPDADEKSEIVHAVLSEHTGPRETPACVYLSDEGEALMSERAEIAQLQRAVADAAPSRRARLIADLEYRRSPRRQWARPARPSEQVSLSEQNLQVLQAAETAALSMPASGQADITLDMDALPDTLRGRPPGCDGISFTAPAIVGNVAFVETTHTCASPEPGLCGSGAIYALSRSGGRWYVEAWATTWIS